MSVEISLACLFSEAVKKVFIASKAKLQFWWNKVKSNKVALHLPLFIVSTKPNVYKHSHFHALFNYIILSVKCCLYKQQLTHLPTWALWTRVYVWVYSLIAQMKLIKMDACPVSNFNKLLNFSTQMKFGFYTRPQSTPIIDLYRLLTWNGLEGIQTAVTICIRFEQ